MDWLPGPTSSEIDSAGSKQSCPIRDSDRAEPLGESGKDMNDGRRVLIIAEPELGRALESTLRASDWQTFRSPDIGSLASTLSSVQPHLLLIGLDAPWFDATALNQLVSASEWRIPVIALTSLVSTPIPGPVTFLPATTTMAELLQSVEQTAAIRGIRAALPLGHLPKPR